MYWAGGSCGSRCARSDPTGPTVPPKPNRREFWRGKRVLVTGHTGFKGAWFVQLLDALGARVFGYALLPDADPSLFRLARLDRSLGSVESDVRDGEKLAAA